MPLRLDNNGETTRDFIFVEDIANGLICCALYGKKGGVYNLASGKEISIGTLARTICKLTNSKSELLLKPKRSWDNSGRRYGDPTKAFKEINFKANISFDEGIQKTIKWTKENYKLIKSCIDKHEYFMN